MGVFLELLILLLLTRVFSEGAERLRQPAAVGKILAGIGLAVLANLFWTKPSDLHTIGTQ